MQENLSILKEFPMPEKTPTHEISYVPAETNLPEFTLRALILGILMAVVLGAANAYLGLRAGMTISATFPAAVIAIAAFRLPLMRGSVLEQNTACTTAGEHKMRAVNANAM